MTLKNFIYSDVNQYDPTNKGQLINGEVISQSLHIILTTRKGEVPFDPEFGIDLDDNLFDLVDDISALVIEREVIEAILSFEPRLELDLSSTKVVPFPDENKFEVIVVGFIVGLEEDSFSFTAELAA